MNRVKIIAFYLPQFYPIPENNKWWGKGFTEWTNVGKAKPLFRGHYQPRVPADLGYYDLRIKDVREQQAALARQAGIEGFCYWHYWFETNKQMMSAVFNEVLSSGSPKFPFCLGWANHSWFAKTWNKDIPDKLLCEQKYLGEDDYNKHFFSVLKAFKDKRYLKQDGNPIFYIYDPKKLPDDFIPYWNSLALKNGFNKICFIGRLTKNIDENYLLSKGFEYLAPERLNDLYGLLPLWQKILYRGIKLFSIKPKYCYKYKKAYPTFIDKTFDRKEHIIPFIMPQWDHSPRSGKEGTILYNSTPELFRNHIDDAFAVIKDKKNKLIFLKSWNEWGEGNYMEPDLKYGMEYINVLGEETTLFNKQ